MTATKDGPLTGSAGLVTTLTALLAATLGRHVAEIDPERSVLDYGLDSLRALALKLDVEELHGLGLPPACFVEGWSIARIADELTRAGEAPALPVVPAGGRPGIHPASRGQEALWFLHQLAPESTAYTVAEAMRLVGPLDVAALGRALATLVERHASLRTTFHATDTGLAQEVHAAAGVALAVEDATALTDAGLAARLDAEASRPFDLATGPLLRTALFVRGATEHVLLLALHHVVCDLWSLTLIARELSTLYAAERAGVPAVLPPVRFDATDFARWQADMLSGPEGARLGRYWTDLLAGALPTLALPTDRPRPAVRGWRGAAHRETFDAALVAGIRGLAKAHAATPFMTLVAAFQVLLHRYSGQDDIVVGTPAAGRTRSEWASVTGDLMNPVVLRADLAGAPAFGDFLAQVRTTVLGALDHQDFPFPLLVERLQPPRDASRSPLFQVMFQLQPTPALELAGLTVQPVPLAVHSAQMDITLALTDAGDTIHATWTYDSDLFMDATIARMARHFRRLVQGIVDDAAQPVDALPLLDAAERTALLATGHDPSLPAAGMDPVDAFLAHVAQAPDRTAATFADTSLTYGALAQRALRLAAFLHAAGVGPDVLVGICVDRSPDLLVALLGVLIADGAYVPLDPSHPRDRIAAVLDDARPAVLLTQTHLRATLPATDARVVCLDAGDLPDGDDRPALPSRADQLAYVIYTSGSTGTPKGVQVPRNALANFLASMAREPGLTADDVLVAVTTVSFDIAALELLLPLTVGARVVVADRDVAADGHRLATLLAEESATVLQATPVTWRLLLEAGWTGSPTLTALCGGEALPRELAARLLGRTRALWNMYGPTETTIWSAVHRVKPATGPVPLGHPIANTTLHALDRHLAPVPPGVAGELCIGGQGVARGYLGRPELTADRFVTHPETGERLYRTGDLVRRHADGALEFLGRLDHQVKVRGFRIEPGEIEAVLARHPAVRQAVAMARDDGGERRLVAYVAATGAPAVADLRALLRAALPEYMVPAAIVVLDALPLTPNGKVDRRALPAPPRPAPPAAAPRTRLEATLGALWCEVLGLDAIGLDDDFFELGGTSLGAARLAARLSTAVSSEVPVRFVMLHPTVAGAAAALAGDAPMPEPCQPAASGAAAVVPTMPFTVIERRPLLSLLAAGQLAPVDGVAIASVPDALRLATGLTRDAFLESWCDGLPLFARVDETPLGRIGLVLLPAFDGELYRDPATTARAIAQAVGMARRLGARAVSLTGLLPSATDYGRAVVDALADTAAPPVTTGHATTAAAVAMSVASALAQAGREPSRERIAFLGLGSVGGAVARLLVQTMPHPAEIILCDVPGKRPALVQLAADLAARGYGGPVTVLESRAAAPDALYAATVVVGATNVPDVLDVDQFRPGTIVVDDSAPHCFDVTRAIRRMQVHADVLFTEGGMLRAPSAIAQTTYVPRAAGETAPELLARFTRRRADEITGCVLSSLLTARFGDELPVVIGLPDDAACLAHHGRLRELGFSAPALRCEDYEPSVETIAAFRQAHGVQGSGTTDGGAPAPTSTATAAA